MSKKKVLFAALMILVFLILACGESGGGQKATPKPTDTPAAGAPTNTPAPTPTPAPAATPTPEPQPAVLGDAVERDGYSFTAIAVEDPATPGMLYQPKEGKKLVAVEVIVGNISGKQINSNPLDVTLLDSEGFAYRTELGGRDDQLAVVTLNPGERVQGWVSFEVPDGAVLGSIKYQISLLPSIVLQTSLIEPGTDHIPVPGSEFVRPSFPPLGEVVEQDGYSFSAVTVEDPATPGMLYKAQEGRKLVAVEVIVGNVSGEQITANPLNATLIDTNGFSYRPELGGRDGQLETIDLNPAEKVKGWIAFEIPQDASVESIKYEMTSLSGIVLQTGLER